MDVASLYEVQTNLMELINSLWELWLAGTFAMIVAFHAGRDSLNLVLLVTGCILYLAACISIAMRYMAYAVAIGGFNQQLMAAGHAEFPYPEWFPVNNALTTATTFVVGTLAAIVFAITQYLKNRRQT